MSIASDNWAPMTPTEVVRWLSDLNVPWWVAGGWALDVFVGHQTRPHGDLDIGVLRQDVSLLLEHLASWEFFEAHRGEGKLLPRGATPRPEVNSLWGRPAGSDLWMLELMLDHSDKGQWLFQRHPQISRPLAAIVRHNAAGLPYLAPEIQLLYKAPAPRPRDQTDFNRVAPLLDVDGRAWLRRSLETYYPQHEWIRNLG